MMSLKSCDAYYKQTFLDIADVDSLENLAAIKTKHLCIDVLDEYGHVGKPYTEGTKASIYRSAMWLTGISGNSNDIHKIKLLFDRVIWAFYCVGEDHSSLLRDALVGLEMLQSKYSHVEARKEVVKQIQDISKYGKKIFELIRSGERLQLEKRLKEYPAKKMAPIGKRELLVSKTCENESIKRTAFTRKTVFKTADMGFFWHILKLDAFMRTHELSEEDITFINHCMRALKHGIEVYQATHLPNYYSPKKESVTLRTLMERSKPDAGKAVDKAFSEIADTEIGMVVPVTFNHKSKERADGRGGHTTVLGIRKDSGEFFITQYNIGLGALGKLNTKDVEAAVVFGPYSKSELLDVIKRAVYLPTKTFTSRSKAVKAFHNLFDPDRRLEHGRPFRHMQVTGNCSLAGVNEWFLDICQRHKKVDLYNKIYAFAQVRSRKEPRLLTGKDGIWDAEKVHRLDFASVDEDGWLEVTLPEKEKKEA